MLKNDLCILEKLSVDIYLILYVLKSERTLSLIIKLYTCYVIFQNFIYICLIQKLSIYVSSLIW